MGVTSFSAGRILSPLRALRVRRSVVATWTIGFLLTIAAFALIGYVYYHATNELEENERWVAHTHEVLAHIEQLVSTAKDAETGQRGYLLTGREEYLQPYKAAFSRTDSEVAALRELVSDNPTQVNRVDDLSGLLRARFALLDETLALRKSSGEQAAKALILTGTGKDYMDRVRAVAGDMENDERRLLSIRARKSEASHRQADVALWAATLTGLALVSLVFWMLRRHLAALVREKDAHQAASVERSKLQGIIGSAMDAIITVDHEQKIVLFNDAAENIFGYRAEEVLDKPLDVLIPVRSRERHREHVKGFGASGVTTRSMHSPGVLSGLKANGEEFPIEATISHIVINNQSLFTVILRDITDRIRTQEQLQQAQKMEAIGRLAGGVAHDFNNLLNIILGYSELLANALPDEDSRREWVVQITNGANTGALLTKQLLAFSRKQSVAPQQVDLAQAVREFDPMLRRLLREDIHLTIRTADRPCTVKVDPGQIQQLLLNLAVNARDAMTAGGNLDVEVRPVHLKEEQVQQHGSVPPGDYAMLRVSDTGIGMKPEVSARIFEPFFTTKAEGKGTGLGLATVFGIVKQNGGAISLQSEPGVGTTFTVYLPLVTANMQSERPAPQAAEALNGTETVLLVEDSRALRQLTREVLVRAGYEVLEAEDGVHALEMSDMHDGRIDLLLTDVVMPRMSGPELARRMSETRPDICTVFMSGYIEEALQSEFRNRRGSVLEKPYTSEALLRTVRQVLDEVELRTA